MGTRLVRLSLTMVMVLMASRFGYPQTTVVTPQASPDSCETGDCLANGKSPEPQGKIRNLPYRVWQVDDAAMQSDDKQDKKNDRRGKPARDDRELAEEERAFPELESETEFQQLVERVAGGAVPIFGRDFFFNSTKQRASLVRVPVSPDYVLAEGDHLLIHIWGQMEFSSRVIVDRNGQIFLPKLGMITVTGVRYDQLHDYLKNNISRSFKNFDLSVSLGQMRLISVTLAGRARHAGRYGLSSESTLVNALTRSGGPMANGSMRHIQLKRKGKIIAEFDAYDLLVRGSDANDTTLLSGDVIYIPPVGPQVAVLGSVNQPAVYELKGATTVGEQIEAAGGLNATADPRGLTLETIEDHVRKVESLAFDEAGKQHRLRDGDIVRVLPVSPRFENAVTLRGNVARPGRYPWRPGMRVQDLIPSREAIITSGYWMAQDAMGQTPPGWLEHPSGSKPVPESILDPGNAVRQDGNLEAGQSPGSPVAPEALPATVRSLAEINWDYAVVQRLEASDLTTRLLPFHLGHALQDPNSADNLALEAGDVVTIFSQRDLSVPAENRTKFIRVEGEVRAAGIYRAQPGETLRQIVARAGGLTPQAYLFASVFERASTRREQQEELDRMLRDMEQEMHTKAARVVSTISPEERVAGREELEIEKSMIEKLRQSPVSGRIVLDLKSADRGLDSLPALPLEDGDRIVIPTRPATVEVVGAVYNQGAFLYREGKSMRDYLSQSGGATRNADAGRMFVVRADGSVLSKQMRSRLWSGGLEFLRMVPGDTIVVPERIRSSNLARGFRDWSQVFSQFALGAAALRVIAP